jgi:hypothetical protein
MDAAWNLLKSTLGVQTRRGQTVAYLSEMALFNTLFKNCLNILSRDWVWLYTGFELVIGFIKHLQNVTTNKYDSLTELHTPKTTVTTAHITSSQSSLAVAW